MNTKITYKSIAFKIFAGLFVLLPIFFNPLGFEVFSLPRVFLLYLAVFILVLIFFYIGFAEKKLELRYGNIHGLVAVFFLFILLSFIFSKDKYAATWGFPWDYEGIVSWISYLLIMHFGYLYMREDRDLKKLSFIISFPVFLVSIFALLQYFFNWEIMQWFQKTELKRASSLLGHPSYLGIYYILYLPLVYYALKKLEKNRIVHYFLLATLLSGLIGLILSFSRGAWLGFAATVITYYLLNRNKIFDYFKKNGKIILMAVGFSLIMIAVFNNGSLMSRVADRALSITDPNSATTQVRMILYKQSVLMLEDVWLLGIGPDNYAYRAPRYFQRSWDAFHDMVADRAHNQFLDYWISFGIGGLASFIILLAWWTRLLFKSSEHQDREISEIAKIILSIILGYTVALQFHYSTIDLAPMFWFLIGASLGLMAEKGIIKEKVFLLVFNDKYFKYYKISFFVTILFLGSSLIFFGYKRLTADMYFAQGVRSNEPIDAKIELLERSIGYNHYITNYHLALNELYIAKGSHGENQYLQTAIDKMEWSRKYLPLDYRLSYALGETYLRVIDRVKNKDFAYNQAKSAYEDTLSLYPNFVDANLKLGVVFAHLGNDKKAMEYWEKCVNLNINQSQCYYNLSVIYKKIGNIDEANRNYQRYVDLNFKNK
jgi:hypothetical protein